MHLPRNYDVYIFDCDGVLLDSNKLKIIAMRDALESFSIDKEIVRKCVDYFSQNFGKSRYHHIDFFLKNFLRDENLVAETADFKCKVLLKYAKNVDKSYSDAKVIPGVISILDGLNGELFVASGSEQKQLQSVLESKGLSSYFQDIFGSPRSKTEIVANIISQYQNNVSVVLVGDSVADYAAASNNAVDFIGLSGYSNTPELLKHLCVENNKICIEYWR